MKIMKEKSLFFLVLILITLFCFGVFGLVAAGTDVIFENPFAAEDFQEFVDRVVGIVWTIAIVVVPGLIILGAFYLLTSLGNPEKIKVGQNIILYTVIGFIVIMVSGGVIDLFREQILEIGHPWNNNGENNGENGDNGDNGDNGVVEPPVELEPKQIIFVTTEKHHGNFVEGTGLGNFCRDNMPANLQSAFNEGRLTNTRAFVSINRGNEIQDIPSHFFPVGDPIYWWHSESETEITTLIADNWTDMLTPETNIATTQEGGTGHGGSVWTGSYPDGSMKDICRNWTSDSSEHYGIIGHPGETTEIWLDSEKRACNESFYLRCIAIYVPRDPLLPPPEPLEQRQIVFVTTGEGHQGDFGERTGLDNFCRDNMPANLLGAFNEDLATNITAFVSAGEGDAIEDIPHNYGFPDGLDDPIFWWHPGVLGRDIGGPRQRLAQNWGHMLDEDRYIETHQYDGTGVDRIPWTGSTAAGKNEADCVGWTSGRLYNFGTSGRAREINNKWLAASSNLAMDRCDLKRPIRCIALYTPLEEVVPFLHVSPTTIRGTLVQGAGWTNIGTVNVTNYPGVGTLEWSETDDKLWLDATPGVGTTTTETDNVTVRASALDLTAGTYIGRITFIGGPPAMGSPDIVTVILTVTAPVPPPPPQPEQNQVVFVTTEAHHGNFGGRIDLNNFCEANMPPNLQCNAITALVSAGEGDAIEDMPDIKGGHFPADKEIFWWHPEYGMGDLIADNWEDMLDGSIVTNQRSGTGHSGFVWTGSWQGGKAAGVNCSNWASSHSGVFGLVGSPWVITSSWLSDDDGGENRCNKDYYLRCICLYPLHTP